MWFRPINVFNLVSSFFLLSASLIMTKTVHSQSRVFTGCFSPGWSVSPSHGLSSFSSKVSVDHEFSNFGEEYPCWCIYNFSGFSPKKVLPQMLKKSIWSSSLRVSKFHSHTCAEADTMSAKAEVEHVIPGSCFRVKRNTEPFFERHVKHISSYGFTVQNKRHSAD